MRLRSVVLLAAGLAGTCSCANRVTGPPPLPSEDIRLELAASGGETPGVPVTISAIIRNEGSAAVLPSSPCPEPYVRIYDDLRRELLQRDPTLPVPCPLAFMAPFEPGSRLDLSVPFDGRYYSESGVGLEAPPGTYAAIATFRYGVFHDGSWKYVTLTREVSFDWQ